MDGQHFGGALGGSKSHTIQLNRGILEESMHVTLHSCSHWSRIQIQRWDHTGKICGETSGLIEWIPKTYTGNTQVFETAIWTETRPAYWKGQREDKIKEGSGFSKQHRLETAWWSYSAENMHYPLWKRKGDPKGRDMNA